MNKNLDNMFDGLMEKTRETKQRLAGLEHETRQPRLATEAGLELDTRSCKRTEDAAADRVINGDISSARRVNTYSATSSTSFGMKTEPRALSWRDDALVDKGADAPKTCISLVRGDAQANRRRWPTTHRHSIYSDEGHLSPTTFFLEPW